jgi:hypothetical protein
MLLVSCPSVKDNITIYRSCVSGTEIKGNIHNAWGFAESDIYLLHNGKPVSDSTTIENGIVDAIPRLVGGKGGLGSLLRTFGKRIKKSTNMESCRDLSGRRLKKINEQNIVIYSGSIHDGTLMHSKTQYTTLDYSSQLFHNSNTRITSTSSLI